MSELLSELTLNVRLFVEIKDKVRISLHPQLEPTKHGVGTVNFYSTHSVEIFVVSVV
ncbi:hypothetical protein II906_08120 [bacterium]|nr:hypothetical protein [bacterium]